MKVKDIISKCESEWIPNERYEEVTPCVSILMPTFCRAKSGLLKKSIDSILMQSFRRFELIIIIDGSTDGTLEICQKMMKKDSRINLIIHHYNMGLPAISEYEGYIRARGEYIAFGFDDNIWEATALAKTYDYMESRSVKASYGITKIVDPASKNTVEIGKPDSDINTTLWWMNSVGNGSVVLHRDIIETVGLYDPHISLTRLCDWDLWQRIVLEYQFVATGVPFCFEHGTTQRDSLGNSFLLDQWFTRERQQHREDSLKPEHYGEIDIINHSKNNSSHFFMCLERSYKQYQNKKWFNHQEYESILQCKKNEKHKYGIIATVDKTACIMTFTRYHSADLTLAFIPPTCITHHLLVYASFLVLNRVINCVDLIELCKKMNIPCMYYVDDNLKEIAIDEDNGEIKEIAKKTTSAVLKEFAAVLVTTKCLKDYFLSHHLHKNVLVISVIGRDSISSQNGTKRHTNCMTIGFMGGNWRTEMFSLCVFPAIKEFSKSIPVRLILPCTKDSKENALTLAENNLDIIPFERTSNYEYLLNYFHNSGIDLLVHCGGNNRNNIYKNKNALLNAVTLDVPLIVSDNEPYCDDSDGSAGTYLTTKNTVTGWSDAIVKISNNRALYEQIKNKARHFVTENFNPTEAWKEFNLLLSKIEPICNEDYIKRYEAYCDWTILHSVNAVSTEKQMCRPYYPEELCFSGEIKTPRRYGFTSEVRKIQEIGLIFAVIGECVGIIRVSIYRRIGGSICSVQFTTSDVMSNRYTNIILPEVIEISANEKLYLEIDIQYEKKDGYIGVFEETENRTFLYKVFNKMKHPIPGKNAIFIDCRE